MTRPAPTLPAILGSAALRAGIIAGGLWFVAVVVRDTFGLDLVGIALFVAAVLTGLQVAGFVVIAVYCRRGGPLDRIDASLAAERARRDRDAATGPQNAAGSDGSDR